MDRLRNLEYIIHYLKAEDTKLSGLQTPPSLTERQQMMRALLNIREPKPIADDFLKAQDAELRLQGQEKGIVSVTEEGLAVWKGDITRLQTDAIVNAANSSMLGCFRPLHGCIDNAIHSAAGVQLRLECNDIMQHREHEARTSECIITCAYNLPSRYVIHTVGPIIPDGIPTPGQEKQLADCYLNALALADGRGLQSIAFCCISTGVFMFPQRRAAEIAVASVKTWLAHHATSIRTVLFNVFKDSDYDIYKALCL